jgi:predicted O-linked N-acetylglucosamine transferase (SPINDLY family)
MKISREEALKLISVKHFEELSFTFLKIFKETYWEKFPCLNPDEVAGLNKFLVIFLDIFISESFIVPETHIISYLKLNPVLSILAAVSDLETTDIYFDKLRINSEKKDLVKILTLLSARNSRKQDYKAFFDTDPDIASYWYWTYLTLVDYVSPGTLANLNNHIAKMAEIEEKLNLNFSPLPHEAFFLVTYINPDKDKFIKGKFNELLKIRYRDIAGFSLKEGNNSAKKKIAVISGLLWPLHAVYKATLEYIKSLTPDYELTMYYLKERLPENFSDFNGNLFNEIYYLEINQENPAPALKQIHDKNFDLIFYPDIGMSPESIILANFRLAPIQVTALGHSVSTYGAETDYFISGTASEELVLPEKNYSEKLVLLPGIGLYSRLPDYRKQKVLKKNEEFIVFCPWSKQKINYRHLENLQKIKERARKKIIFRFLTGIYDSNLLVIEKELAELLGKECIQVIPTVPYQEYMSLLELGDIAIDSFHFGGYNTVIDALYLGKPVITIEGKHAYNRFSAAILKKAGLEELICRDENEFVEKVVRLINNEAYLENLKRRIKLVDLNKKLVETNEPFYFKKAIDFLLENHERLKTENTQKPIIIN